MGLDITYITGKRELSLTMTPVDVDVMGVLAKKEFEQDVEAIFGVSDFEKETPISRNSLLDSIDRLLEAIESRPQILPYTYFLERQVTTSAGVVPSVSASTSGIRINEELYSFEGGLDRCELIRHWQDDSGNWHADEPKDVRGLKSIMDDELGKILIRKRRKPTCLVRNLKQLKSFLLETDAKIIQKVLG